VKRIGVIGCGVIGELIAKSFADGLIRCDGLVLYDKDFEKAQKLHDSLKVPVLLAKSFDDLMKTKPDIIVEAASQEAVREYLWKILAAKIEIVVMSVGALLDMKVKSSRIHVPSGAIGGLDAVSAARSAGIHEATLTTRKSPKALGARNSTEKTVYEGSAEEAVRLYPREMNVAATLALAVKPCTVKVKVISDPRVEQNIHEIKLVWKYGEMFFRFKNDPHPDNPGTSALAAWSAINLIKELLEQ
jgi:aspartate dehydrogenase